MITSFIYLQVQNNLNIVSVPLIMGMGVICQHPAVHRGRSCGLIWTPYYFIGFRILLDHLGLLNRCQKYVLWVTFLFNDCIFVIVFGSYYVYGATFVSSAVRFIAVLCWSV